MSKCSKIVLVHNTFTKKEDVEWVKENDYITYWCTCPKSNLFIENKTKIIQFLMLTNFV